MYGDLNHGVDHKHGIFLCNEIRVIISRIVHNMDSSYGLIHGFSLEISGLVPTLWYWGTKSMYRDLKYDNGFVPKIFPYRKIRVCFED
jgi:hypothetical protein